MSKKRVTMKWIPVFIVESWQTEMKKGVGFQLENFSEGVINYSKVWIVDIDGNGLSKFRDDSVYTNEDMANRRLRMERASYQKYCEEQIEKYSKIVDELKKPLK